jgi:hypothetical protein
LTDIRFVNDKLFFVLDFNMLGSLKASPYARLPAHRPALKALLYKS